MKAEDLRIGNWVDASPMLHGEKNYVQVSRIGRKLITICMGDDDVGDAYEPQIQGILLTPDILERAGFEVDERGWNWHIDEVIVYTKGNTTHIAINESGEFLWYNACNDDYYSWLSPQMKFVHELQNLYHSLTGTDLSIDLK